MVGGVLLWSMIIMPNVQRHLPPAVRGAFLGVMFPRVSKYLTHAGFLVILSGLALMGDIYGYGAMLDVFKSTEAGRALGGGFVMTVAMLAIAMGIIQPSARRLLALAAKGPAEPAASPAGAAPAPAPALTVSAAGGQGSLAASATAVAVTQSPAPPPEVLALQKRLAIASIVNVGLSLLVLATMAWAVALRGL